jgi:hypothetical protein
MNGALNQKEYVRLKSRLTRCLNRTSKAQAALRGKDHVVSLREDLLKEAKAQKKEADAALRSFETNGFPDQWNNWQRASDDAAFIIGRLERR